MIKNNEKNKKMKKISLTLIPLLIIIRINWKKKSKAVAKYVVLKEFELSKKGKIYRASLIVWEECREVNFRKKFVIKIILNSYLSLKK